METRSQQQISMQLSGKAFRIVRFNVRQRIKFVKSEKSTFSSSECLDIVSTASNSVEQRLNSFALDNSLVLRESRGNSRYPSRNRACGMEKFSAPSAERLGIVRSSCCRRWLQVPLKKAAKDCFQLVYSTATPNSFGESEVRFVLYLKLN